MFRIVSTTSRDGQEESNIGLLHAGQSIKPLDQFGFGPAKLTYAKCFVLYLIIINRPISTFHQDYCLYHSFGDAVIALVTPVPKGVNTTCFWRVLVMVKVTVGYVMLEVSR
jgi:hypothetical protein